MQKDPFATDPAEDTATDSTVALTVTLVRAYVTHHTVPPAQLGALLEQTHRTVLGLSQFKAEPVEATPVLSSIKPHCLVCLECGRDFRSLKRHLASHHKLTPAQYRLQWNLPADYPMVAPDYAEHRSRLARASGFGHSRPDGPRHRR